MRRTVLGLIVLLVVAAAVVIGVRWPQREWSTDSPEAMAAFGRGLDDLMRFYREDARRQFQRALELDPSFVAAKVQLLEGVHDKKEYQRLEAELGSADLSKLTDRERFMVEYALARKDEARRSELLAAFLARHARDRWALHFAAQEAWARSDWSAAEELYRRLLATDPNWVMAHNNLGYIAMAQGRFDEAEERFRNYAFVAPDQANPHDSLAELLILRGRYDEARRELEAALAVRPDFCASYRNLFTVAMLSDRPGDVDALLPRIEQHCEAGLAQSIACERVRWTALRVSDFEAPWRGGDPSCHEKVDVFDPLVFRLTLFSGRREAADAQLAKGRQKIEELRKASKARSGGLEALVLHLEGIEKAWDGDRRGAAEALRASDTQAPYWTDSFNGGLRKLAGRLLLARLEEELGDGASATRIRQDVASVNPQLAALEPTPLIAVPAKP